MRKIDRILQDVLVNFQPDIYLKRNKALMLWKKIAGKGLYEFAKPVSYDESILTVKISHPAALMEIVMRKKEILTKLNSVWNEEIFTDIKTV